MSCRNCPVPNKPLGTTSQEPPANCPQVVDPQNIHIVQGKRLWWPYAGPQRCASWNKTFHGTMDLPPTMSSSDRVVQHILSSASTTPTEPSDLIHLPGSRDTKNHSWKKALLCTSGGSPRNCIDLSQLEYIRKFQGKASVPKRCPCRCNGSGLRSKWLHPSMLQQ